MRIAKKSISAANKRTLILIMLLPFAVGSYFTTFPPRCCADSSFTTTSTKQNSSANETIKTTDGNDFMEEVPTPVKKQEPVRIKLAPDLSSLGVPVDPNGNIVPLINKNAGPVLPFYSKTEQTFEPIFQNGYPSLPYGYSPYEFSPFGYSPYPYGPYGYNPYGYGATMAPGLVPRYGMGMPGWPTPNYVGRAPVSFFLNRGGYAAPWFAPPMPAPQINNPYAANPYAPVLYPWF